MSIGAMVVTTSFDSDVSPGDFPDGWGGLGFTFMDEVFEIPVISIWTDEPYSVSDSMW